MSSDSTGCVVGLVVIGMVVVLFAWTFDAEWFYKAYYAMSDNTNYKRVDKGWLRLSGQIS
jgi:hypothetical protein